MACFKILSQHFPGRTEQNHESVNEDSRSPVENRSEAFWIRCRSANHYTDVRSFGIPSQLILFSVFFPYSSMALCKCVTGEACNSE